MIQPMNVLYEVVEVNLFTQNWRIALCVCHGTFLSKFVAS